MKNKLVLLVMLSTLSVASLTAQAAPYEAAPELSIPASADLANQTYCNVQVVVNMNGWNSNTVRHLRITCNGKVLVNAGGELSPKATAESSQGANYLTQADDIMSYAMGELVRSGLSVVDGCSPAKHTDAAINIAQCSAAKLVARSQY